MAHIRIELDSIMSTPRVWIDGERIDDISTGGLVELHLNYQTDTYDPQPKNFKAKWNVVRGTGGSPKPRQRCLSESANQPADA